MIKKDKIDLLLNSQTSLKEKEENDTYFHEIEGLDAAPQMDLFKMVQE